MNNSQLTLLDTIAYPSNGLRENAPVGRFSGLSPEKLRGGYYTPQNVASWIARWAIRDPEEVVLEPSCGDGIFLQEAVDRLRSLGARFTQRSPQVQGVEIVQHEAAKARLRVETLLGRRTSAVSIVSEDFFTWWLRGDRPIADVVFGNPPFIRYQNFPEPSRECAMRIMRGVGLSPNRLTNIWVPFVVAAVASLNPGGRLGLVVPAELLQVSYAGQLRSFLSDHFRRIDIVACNDLLFTNAEQEVVLLLADGAVAKPSAQNKCRVAMTEVKSIEQLFDSEPARLLNKAKPKEIRHDSEKWLKYFLSNLEIELMRRLRQSSSVAQLVSHASVDVGVVTGKNEFFLLSQDQVKKYGVQKQVTPVVARSAHIRGVRFTEEEWQTLALDGARVYLLDLSPMNGHRLSDGCRRYIEEGEAAGVHKGYKCSIRTHWFAVPSVWSPACFLFRQIYDFPRVVLNRAGATSTDTIHRMTCHGRAESVVKNLYTSLTAASAEIEGRSYGGGVLELEPTEAERLLMPAQLNGALPLEESDRLLRADQLDKLIEENDRIVLRDGVGLDSKDCKALNGIWMKMRQRRGSRRRRAA